MFRRQYQQAFARHLGSGHAFAFWKGRAGLYAILKALGIKAGDEIILPAFTCVVVPNTVLAVARSGSSSRQSGIASIPSV